MEIWRELRHSARRLKSAPGFTAVAVITLALAIGANTAIFTVVNSLLLKPLAYPQADRLMVPMRAFRNGGHSQSVSMPRFVHWRDHNTVFSGLAAFVPHQRVGERKRHRVHRAARAQAHVLQAVAALVLQRREQSRPEDPDAHVLARRTIISSTP